MKEVYAIAFAIFVIGVLVGIAAAALWRKHKTLPSGYKLSGGTFVRTFPETRPPDVIRFTPASIVDAEGQPVDPQPSITYNFSSSDESISKIEQLNPGDPNELTVTYVTLKKNEDNSYAAATLKAESSDIPLADGSVLKDVVTEDIQLVPGGAAGFAGGGFNFPPV